MTPVAAIRIYIYTESERKRNWTGAELSDKDCAFELVGPSIYFQLVDLRVLWT